MNPIYDRFLQFAPLLTRLAAAIVIFLTIRITTRKVSFRMERLPKTNLLYAFLREFGSDVRNFGKGLAWTTAIALPAASYWDSLAWWALKLMESYAIILVGVASVVFLNAFESWRIETLDPTISARDRSFALTFYPLFANTCKYVVYGTGITFLLSAWGVDISAVLGGVAVAAIVVGIGAQQLVGDIISGLFIIFERTFYANSRVEVILSEKLIISGQVQRLTWRCTYIKEANGNIVSISNRLVDRVRVLER